MTIPVLDYTRLIIDYPTPSQIPDIPRIRWQSSVHWRVLANSRAEILYYFNISIYIQNFFLFLLHIFLMHIFFIIWKTIFLNQN